METEPPVIPGHKLEYCGNAIDTLTTTLEHECGHPDNKAIAYTEDGRHYTACRQCGAIWEVIPDDADES